MRFYFVLGDFFCMKVVNLSLKIKVNYSPKNVLWFRIVLTQVMRIFKLLLLVTFLV